MHPLVYKIERIAAALLLLSGIAFVFVASHTAGKWFPVVQHPATLSEVLTETDFSTRIRGSAKKLRECDFVRLEWYFGTRDSGRASGVRVDFLEKPKIRPGGWFDFGPWIVHVPVDQFVINSYADAIHQCFVFGFKVPWLTRSKFYTPG